ncbi:hypothetical protein SAMD00019534_011970 [Acytostelium subglobosum LB1]|uniref:hypothetical protein n=1 Tax=Acytostelium subglobosum LB1 TaxID=1410327 RepID=UPI000644C7AE|nr:hypothetical protein SAMD00019534_011970 [Acytostelium subglobosum LB1]GAM18022.1 hypothetical protein SAMD00019534_011970 [Acytostelium subglobosum LB1]|eukprot:XP_012758618.1 hypothetical protein SAMD00019534_011970 [Acytostelium subglobosum LB1]
MKETRQDVVFGGWFNVYTTTSNYNYNSSDMDQSLTTPTSPSASPTSSSLPTSPPSASSTPPSSLSSPQLTAISSALVVRKSDSSVPTTSINQLSNGGAMLQLSCSSGSLLLSSTSRSTMSQSSSSIDSSIFDDGELDSIKQYGNMQQHQLSQFDYVPTNVAMGDNSFSDGLHNNSNSNPCCLQLFDLACEIIIHIFRFLSPFDLRHTSSVCRHWSALCSLDTLWEEKCFSQWSWMTNICEEKLKKNANSSWKDFYRHWATEYVKCAGWYNYSLSRDEATATLQTMAKGTFLIRKSSKANNLVISYNVHSKRPQHLLLYNLGPFVGVFLNDEMGKIYPTISALIKEKKKFLKRPYNDMYNVYEKKAQCKREYLLRMIECPKERQGRTLNDMLLLHIASKWCFRDMIETLISLGANVNHMNPKNGKTPLHYSLCFIHGEPNTDMRYQVVSYLLSDKHQSDSVKMVELLLKHGADVTICQNRGLYPLHIASKENNLAMVKLLLKHKKVDVNCTIAATPLSKLDGTCGDASLHIAAHNCMYPIVKELLECKNIDIDRVDDKKRTALHRCVLRNQDWLGMTRFGKPSQTYFSHQIVDLLFEKGSNPALIDCDNNTALHLSILKGHRQSTVNLMHKVKTRCDRLEPSIFGVDRLIRCIEIGQQSPDIAKSRDDLRYSIICGFREITLDDLDKTIANHYEDIRSLINKYFTPSYSPPPPSLSISGSFTIPSSSSSNKNNNNNSISVAVYDNFRCTN